MGGMLMIDAIDAIDSSRDTSVEYSESTFASRCVATADCTGSIGGGAKTGGKSLRRKLPTPRCVCRH